MQVAKPKKGYKLVETGFGKYKEIPEDWETDLLQNMVEKIKAGGTPKSSEKAYYSGKIPFVTIHDITNSGKYLENTEKTITEKGLSNSNAWLIPANSILFSMYASIGKAVFNRIPVVTHQGILGIISNTKIIHSDFLFYFLTSINKTIQNYTNTGTQANLSLGIVKKIQVIYPSKIQEQQKIALILSNIDNAIQNVIQIIKQTENLRQNLLELAFNGSLTEKWRKKIDFSYPWDEKKFGELILNSRNGFTGKPNDESIGIPRLGITSITRSTSVYANENIYRYIEIEKSKINTYSVQKNDLLVCRQNGNEEFVGKFCVAKGLCSPMIFSDSLIRLRVKIDEILPEYLVLFMNHRRGRNQISKYISTTAGNYSINSTNLKKLKILLPKLKEQKKIFSILSNIAVQLQKDRHYLSNLELLKMGLIQKLLTGKIRVKF